jgi:two-component system alkaline phosphatase synthesis response regulator PhoP
MNNDMQIQPIILLIEDEPNLGQTLLEYLGEKKFNCSLATNVRDAQLWAQSNIPDVILMDIGLPDGSGLDLARIFRKKFPSSLILFLSAQNAPEVRLEGLEIGADDYITKPFALKELLLRIERMLKGHASLGPEFQQFGKIKMSLKRYQLIDANNVTINIGQKECAILALLFERANQAITRDEIMDLIWGTEAFPSPRTVDNYIVKLRKWCDSDPQSPLHIVSIRGIGYKLELTQK